MSWLSTNYEKAALGGAVVAALGLAYFGWSKFNSVSDELGGTLTGKGNNNAAVKNADLIPKAISSLKLDRTVKPALDGERPVDLFSGVPLFIASTAPTVAIDLVKGEPVHPPIENKWWIANQLDPGFADAASRDPDKDGFSNLEEYTAKTDPNDEKSLPSLIGKLLYIRDESLGWVIQPRMGSAGSFPFKYQDTKGGTNTSGSIDLIAPGGVFFPNGVMANRFKFVSSEIRKEMSKSTGVESEVTYVKIEDQRDNKKGRTYEFMAPLGDGNLKENLKYDRTAIFSLEALGLNGKEFKVEENTAFAIPPDSPIKNYFAKTVTPDSVTIEYKDASGAKKTLEISKGQLPQVPE